MNDIRTAIAFPHLWTAEILRVPPLIAPARQYTYPRQIAGEEDALARGGPILLVCLASASFPSSPSAPWLQRPRHAHGIFSLFGRNELCAAILCNLSQRQV